MQPRQIYASTLDRRDRRWKRRRIRGLWALAACALAPAAVLIVAVAQYLP